MMYLHFLIQLAVFHFFNLFLHTIDINNGKLGTTALVTVKILHRSSSSLADRSSTSSLCFLGDFLLMGMVTDVGSMGRLREGKSSFHNRLPAEFTKCSLHTRVLLFTGRFFRPIYVSIF